MKADHTESASSAFIRVTRVIRVQTHDRSVVMAETIFVINPGSTSTKVGLFRGDEIVFQRSQGPAVFCDDLQEGRRRPEP